MGRSICTASIGRINLHKNSQAVEKGAAHAKKDSMKKL